MTDVKELTPEAIGKLTDTQIDEQLGVPPAQPAKEPPPEPSPKATPGSEPPPETVKAKEGEPPAVAPAKEPAEPAAPAEKLLAGKYKTNDDLGKGLLEIGKALKYNPKTLERFLGIAKKTGDWAEVEQAYLELQETLSKNQKAASTDQPPAKEEGTPKGDQPPQPATAEERQALAEEMHVLMAEVAREMEDTPVVREMKEQGIPIPKTREEFRQLKTDYPYYARDFNDQFMATYKQLQKEIGDYNQALQTVESHTTTAKESAKQQIGEYNKEFGLKLDDAKIQEIIDQALKSEFVYETKSGVKFVRDNGIAEHFLAKQFPTLAKAIKTNGELDGRKQHLDDLDTMQKKTLSSISTSHIPPTRREKGKVNLDDPQQVAGVSDDDMEKHFRGEQPLN